MPLPAGIQMVEGRFGTAVSIFGETVSMKVEVTPSHDLVWASTGQPVLAFKKAFVAGPDVMGFFSVPAVDQNGFRLQSTQIDFKMWAYTVDITYTSPSAGTKKRTIVWQPLVGQTEVDLDLIGGGQVSFPISGDVAFVTSVAGLTGEVTKAELEALGLGGTGGAAVTWANITGKPAVIASGTTQAAARTSIGAVATTDIDTKVNAAISALVGSAPTSLDTLKEISDALAADDADISSLLTALGTRATITYVDQKVAEASGGASLAGTTVYNILDYGGVRNSETTQAIAANDAAIATICGIMEAQEVMGLKLQSSVGAFQGGANAPGGGVLFFPAGTFVHSGIELPHRAGLSGVGMGTNLKLKNAATKDSVSNKYNANYHAKYVFIEKIQIDGNGANKTFVSRGIAINGTIVGQYNNTKDEDFDQACTIDRVYVRNTKGIGVEFTNSGRNYITSLQILRSGSHGLKSSYDNNISGLDVGHAGGHGVWIEGDSVRLEGSNKVWRSAQHGAYITADSGQVSITAQDNAWSGLVLDNAHNIEAHATLESNSFGNAGTYPALSVYDSDHNVVTAAITDRYSATNPNPGPQNFALMMTNGSIKNDVRIAAGVGVWGTDTILLPGAVVNPDNNVWVNGAPLDVAAFRTKIGASFEQKLVYNGSAWPATLPAGWSSTGDSVFKTTTLAGAPTPPAWAPIGSQWFPHPDDL